ncbi:ABC transporter substrate-binding protein [Micromonospora sp. HM5-17]|jgi:multiple sugar transport system substrate-binding protein|uniref:ABC transporter substrate-binding protein n=1 Tax=Micromonospora sp. HM5-17 TaxID=2487710 RepID=UPI000F48CD4B|nr:ABC transporter substrate-binding protein [Micromonospora sp. HM5-17]ROT29760.1 carbohydrate ABC transporter substrate-binding protein [Micromonospora sp. HM5-17]
MAPRTRSGTVGTLRSPGSRPALRLDRRRLLGLGLTAGAAPLLTACGGASTSGSDEEGAITFLSTQFTPVEERRRFEQILRERVPGGAVAYNPVEGNVFASTITSQVAANRVQISLVGGLHGDLAPHADRFENLDELMAALGDRRFPPEIAALGRLSGGATTYVPWMQASYVLAVHKRALEWLPSGVDVQNLSYDQFLTWVTAARRGNGGRPVFGLPCGPKGLYHRFFQGYLLPSFTGGQITTFRSPEAIQAWRYLAELWAQTAPASTNFDSMQEPLQRGEVLVAWDHVARLVNAPAGKPDDWVMAPAPRGPKGLGYMLVVAGLAIPRGAPEADRARQVIEALTTPEVQLEVLRRNAFFPVVDAPLPADLPPAIALEAEAIRRQQAAEGAIVALPPVGLGARDGEVSQIFKNCFTEICLDRRPVPQVLDRQARELNRILDELAVPCWRPDPVGAGQPCRVP